MSANLDVQNRNSVELIGKDANICPPSDGDTLKRISDMEETERHCVSSENSDQSLRPECDSSAAEPVDGVENLVDNNSNSNVPFVNIDNVIAEIDGNENDQGTVLEHDNNVTVEENGKTDCQDTAMVSPSDSGSAQADSISTNSCEGLVSESCSSPHDASVTDSAVTQAVDVESPSSATESNGQSAADVPMTQEQMMDGHSLVGAAADIRTDEGNEGAAAYTPAAGNPERSSSHTGQSTYHVKWIKFHNVSVPIITQNENGPCPLIAIMNVLLLQRKVKLPPMMEMITSSQLMDYLGDCILEHEPKNISEDAQLNYEQNMHDAMAVFHKLQTGLDVNVKFTGISSFEYTSECIVFDLLGIPLHHGWLVDPENRDEVKAIGQCSYNQLVEKIIAQKSSPVEEKVREALIAEEFLTRTAHQLTYHGLIELASTLRDQQLCVFFRNNHFSTLYKYKDELFLLVTDQGFLTESNVVWETLSNVEGDGEFVDASFCPYHKSEPSTQLPSGMVEVNDQLLQQDFLVALSLQQEQQQQAQYSNNEWQSTVSDHEYALKLQEEENRRAAEAHQRQENVDNSSSRPQTSSAHPQRQPSTRGNSSRENTKKTSDCVIL